MVNLLQVIFNYPNNFIKFWGVILMINEMHMLFRLTLLLQSVQGLLKAPYPDLVIAVHIIFESFRIFFFGTGRITCNFHGSQN